MYVCIYIYIYTYIHIYTHTIYIYIYMYVYIYIYICARALFVAPETRAGLAAGSETSCACGGGKLGPPTFGPLGKPRYV